MKGLDFALTHEQNGIAMYEAFSATFAQSIFSEILSIKKTGLKMLTNLVNSANLPYENTPNLGNFNYSKVQNLQDALEIALSYEIKTAILYDEISSNLSDETQKDLIFRLWATSENEYKQALKSEISNIYLAKNAQNSAKTSDDCDIKNGFDFANFGFDKEKMSALAQILQKFSQNKADKDDIIKILNHPYASFLAGAALGGVGGILFNQILSKDENE